MKIFVLNGPNLNLLGVREPSVYGSESYESLLRKIEAYCLSKGIEAEYYQTNHEGELVDLIHKAFFAGADGIVINPGAYTHTSIALLDAVKATSLPTVEVHISDLYKREDFRRISYIRAACIGTVSGRGTDGYIDAIALLEKHKGEK